MIKIQDVSVPNDDDMEDFFSNEIPRVKRYTRMEPPPPREHILRQLRDPLEQSSAYKRQHRCCGSCPKLQWAARPRNHAFGWSMESCSRRSPRPSTTPPPSHSRHRCRHRAVPPTVDAALRRVTIPTAARPKCETSMMREGEVSRRKKWWVHGRSRRIPLKMTKLRVS